MDKSLLAKLLAVPSAVVIGSQRLGLKKCKDYDIAMLKEEFDAGSFEKVIEEMNKYFDVPPMGNSYLARYYQIDVFLYEREQSLAAVRRVMNKMLALPKSIMVEKSVRVSIFEGFLKEEKDY